MATLLFPLIFLLVRVELNAADPAPRKVPKVYNALITSNQNLEPSKAFPVYQPVLHNALPFPYHPVVYGDYPLSPGFLPVPLPAAPANPNTKTVETKPATPEPTVTEAAVPENPEPAADSNVDKDKDVPPPPSTESPIPLNQFGLPPQVLPLGRINPTYAISHINPYPAYSYSGFGLYDPYSPFGLNPLNFASYPIYGPLNNLFPQYSPSFVAREPPAATPAPEAADGKSTPPPEPSDLNVLNYAPKDPAIPNVPPPPLPQGGLKSDEK
ncbi:leucine-rich repeat extensin-like protein 5 [Aricia agestis]|uniref:leucine-rich repeat extensin-like protein 5 n=1 Tax=Aricia agestis TaxID=91739 RepID=UPI001C204D3A|nr:leucine-rich repeat extensin-like protein 5 [Aricia agestis]